MTIDRKVMRQEILFLVCLFTAIGGVCLIVWSAH